MGKVNVLRLNFPERQLERLRLPTNGATAVDHKAHRGISIKRAKPVAIKMKSRFTPWPKETRYILWQHGDGDPLDLSAEKNYQDDTRKVTSDEVASTEDEYTNEALIRVEHPPVNYSLARIGMTAMLAVTLAVLIAFAVLYFATGRFEFEMPDTGPGFAILVLGALTPTMRRFPAPGIPPSIKAAWSWVWEAAKVEPRVAVGLGVGLCIAGGVGGVLLILGLLSLLAGEVGGAIAYLFFAVCAALGFALPVFAAIAWPKLFVRQIVLSTKENAGEESWEHPKLKNEKGPAYWFQEGKDAVLVMTTDGTPFRGREKASEISDEEVYDIQDTADVETIVRPSRIPWEKIESWLIIGVIGMGFFLLLVIWEELQKGG